MPLADHLRELRSRILLSFAGIAVGAIAGWFLYHPLTSLMVEPLAAINARGGHAELNFASVGMAFEMQFKIAIFIGIFISSPWWILQGWLFIAPALHRREKVIALSFTFVAALLFLGGAMLGWFVLPRAVVILTDFAPDFAVNLFDARAYYRFFMQLIGAFGVSFLLPVVMVGINFIGLVKGKTYLAGWRWSVVGCAVFAAIVNPLPDVWSMLAITIPMIVLYFTAVGVSLLHDRAVAKRRRREIEQALGEDDLVT